jgi:hypothetical protein
VCAGGRRYPPAGARAQIATGFSAPPLAAAGCDLRARARVHEKARAAMPTDGDGDNSIERWCDFGEQEDDLEPSSQPNVRAKDLVVAAGRLVAALVRVEGSGGFARGVHEGRAVVEWAPRAARDFSEMLGVTVPLDRQPAALAELRAFGAEAATVLVALREANDSACLSVRKNLKGLPQTQKAVVEHWDVLSDWEAPGSPMHRWLLGRVAALIDTGVFDSTPDRAIATRSGVQSESSDDEEEEGEEEDLTSDESESEGEASASDEEVTPVSSEAGDDESDDDSKPEEKRARR